MLKTIKVSNQRRDIITRKSLQKSELNRIVLIKEGKRFFLDNENKFQGRSIYFSKNKIDINKMISKDILLKKIKQKNFYNEKDYLEVIKILRQEEAKNDDEK